MKRVQSDRAARREVLDRPDRQDEVLRKGANCWRVERAVRFRCVQDGEEYFRLVREALLAARRSVFILGWDIYSAVDLAPGGVDDGAPTKLAELLDFVVQRTPELEVYVLVWDYAALYALERDPTSSIRMGWQTHERVHFQFDDLHPVAGSHHQKVVVVDDAMAFSGGLDLTSHRWDTRAHPVVLPLRLSATGEPYTPFHDVQALVEGPIAAWLGELCRERWRKLGTETLPALDPRAEIPWPASVTPDIVDVDVAIARTSPTFRGQEAVRECEALFQDQIAAARGTIYLENQYFTNADLGEALAARLREPDGPEVVFVGPRECSGWLEQKTMGVLRRAVLVNLVRSDLHGRLRLLYPVASVTQNVFTFVHSKILVIDDEHLRIGSANLSSRSMGMDTECDLIAVANGEDRVRKSIRAVRDRLVGEHLGLEGEEVSRAIEQHGSLRAAIDALATGDHTLARVEVDLDKPVEELSGMRLAVDPSEPMELSRTIDRFLPALEHDDGAKRTRGFFVAACAFGALAIAMRGASGAESLNAGSAQQLVADLAADDGALRWIFGATLAAGLLFVPFELLVLLPVVLLGAVRGTLVAIVSSAVCAVIGYAIGRLVGPRPLAPLLGRRAGRIWSGLRRHGSLAIALVRFTALFSATSVHVLCGAARVSARDYAIGTALGLAPALIASVLLGVLLRSAIVQPSPLRYAIAALAAGVIALAILRLRRIVLMRVQGTARREQDARARFG